MHKPGIFPPVLPREMREDPRRQAEIRVYDRLRDQLEGFTVFYHCPWYDENAARGSRDGEADFVVAHPHWGFVVLEVKGGIVSRDENTRIWRSRNKQGHVFEIKNPVEQALVSKHVILRKLRDTWRGKTPFIRAKHGVVLPDSGQPRSANALGADMPLEIFAFTEDMDQLGAKVVKILMTEPAQSETRYGNLGEHGIEILHQLFDRGFELDVGLAALLAADENKILRLTEQQNTYLDLTKTQRRAIFTGGAGTGKTTLAIEKSTRLAQEGAEVLLLCFNNALSAYLLSQVKSSSNITASSFHKFCLSAIARSGISFNHEGDSDRRYFDKILPEALLAALSADDDLRYDAIVVDEGQDFLESWWEPLLLTLKDTDGTFFVFKDDNQRIYRGTSKKIPGFETDPLHLSINFRNTRSIFRATEKYYEGGDIRPGGPEGKEIEWCPTKLGDEAKEIERTINRLINIEGIPEHDIVVLCACAREKSVLAPGESIGRYETAFSEDFSGKSIRFDSIHRFKGLESKVVILTDMDGAVASSELMYVGLSRARLLLFVVASEATVTKLKNEIYGKD